VYQELFDMETALIDAAETSGVYCQYRETVADEDRVDGFKLMALRLAVQG